MRPASRTLGVIGFALAMGLQTAPLCGQGRDSLAPSPFDPIARRVLTLKLESETLRGRLNDGWPPHGWKDSLAAMRTDLDALTTEARRLHAPQLLSLVDRVRASLDGVSRARNQRDARTALAHLTAGLDALRQKITELESKEE
jgi:hypothetical protein